MRHKTPQTPKISEFWESELLEIQKVKMNPLDELRKKVEKRKHTFFMLCFLSAFQVFFGSIILHFVLTHSALFHEIFTKLLPENSKAVLVHPVLIVILGVGTIVQGGYTFISAITNKNMILERTLLQHIDKDSTSGFA